MIYTVTFNPALDYVVGIEEFKLGVINRTKEEDVFYGGKGINVSVILKELGIDSVALGFTAGFTGREIAKGVERLGVKTDFIHLEEGMSRINIKIKSGEETEINGQGPKITKEALEELFVKLDALQDDDTLVLAGSIPNTLPDDIYETIIDKVSHKKIQVVVDATKELLKKVLRFHPFLIKPNNHELGELFGVELKTDDEIIYYAKQLQNQGARNVLISMAGDGAILVVEDGAVHKIEAPTGIVLNSVGAGDSMVAGFLAGYIKTGDYRAALTLGTASGSATAFNLGLATREDINKLYSTIV